MGPMTGLKTEACKQGLHARCDGTGTTEGGASVICECTCHGTRSAPDSDTSGALKARERKESAS